MRGSHAGAENKIRAISNPRFQEGISITEVSERSPQKAREIAEVNVGRFASVTFSMFDPWLIVEVRRNAEAV